jgi:hypothetical protein
MERGIVIIAVVAAGMGLAGCGTGSQDPEEIRSEVEVTGCLTGNNDQFVLTELDRADTGTTIASPATESYKLIGDATVLRPHVGKQVQVSGMAETPDVAIVRESSPAAPVADPGVGTSGSQPASQSNAGQQPKISTEQQTRLEVSSLRVRSVKPTGGSCAP